MSTEQLIFLSIVFAVGAGTMALALWLCLPNPARQRARGLIAKAANPAGPRPAHEEQAWIARVAQLAQPLAKLSLPEAGWENSPMRTRFFHAGWRKASAPVIFLASKTVLTLGLPLLFTLFAAPHFDLAKPNTVMFGLLFFAACGYYLPNVVLARAITVRQREIFENFPDALDLLTVCVEAGLSLDNALTKVADEIHIKSLVLSQELQLLLLEMRAGLGKEKALRNLALRSGVEDVDTLVAMLIQAERFGTSMGDSLRVHAETLRTKRRLRAEEAAAKIALKLLFPLIFFIFPTLLLVLLGPAMVQIYRVLLPATAGN